MVSVSRAGERTPVTHTLVDGRTLRESSPAGSLPMALNLCPSVVATNEGGTGLGYSKMTVRGVPGAHINVTLNGITLNDAESQEVFWVNIPALAQLVSSVQLQRGLGTSANGPGAFGASLNLLTASTAPAPSGSFELGRGSYRTLTSLFSVSSGLTAGGFHFSAAYSGNRTDGYMRNARADVQSALISAGWIGERHSLKMNFLYGEQHSGITWTGVPLARYAEDRTCNPAGEYRDRFGNLRFYDRNTDNYFQRHFQLIWTHCLTGGLTWSATCNYTSGYGYTEQYKPRKQFRSYGFAPAVLGQDGLLHRTADFVARKVMENDYYVIHSDLKYVGTRLELTGGVYLSTYGSQHYGKVIWTDVLGADYDYSRHRWYSNRGRKPEANVFARAEYRPAEALSLYGDLQWRCVRMRLAGEEEGMEDIGYGRTWNFFNPRAGLHWRISGRQRAYFSVALGHREPGRPDLKEQILKANALDRSDPQYGKVGLKPERMTDVEAGYAFSGSRFSAEAVLYCMEYGDMLLQTGKVSDSGYALKENVGAAFRRGIELSLAWQPARAVRIDGSLTFSANKIKHLTAFQEEYDNADSWGHLKNVPVVLGRTPMLKSPSRIGFVRLALTPFRRWKNTGLSLDCKAVSPQFWDNTGSAERRIPGYAVADLTLRHEIGVRAGTLGFVLYVNNLAGRKYYADAWVYRVHFRDDDSWYQEEGLFSQPLRNCLCKVFYRF